MTAAEFSTTALRSIQQEATKAGMLIVVVVLDISGGGQNVENEGGCLVDVASNTKDEHHILHALSHAVEAVGDPDAIRVVGHPAKQSTGNA